MRVDELLTQLDLARVEASLNLWLKRGSTVKKAVERIPGGEGLFFEFCSLFLCPGGEGLPGCGSRSCSVLVVDHERNGSACGGGAGSGPRLLR